MSSPCSRCQSKGLVIYPFRYAVLPSNLGEQYRLPSWAEDPHLKKLQLQSDTMYGLRTMREGFLYVLIDQEGEDLQWRVYKVDENAQLWPLSEISDELKYNNKNKNMPVPANPANTGCEAARHQDDILSFFVLEQADQCKAVWIAYSQHRWRYKTLKKYQESAQSREIRMKKIQPQAWLSAARQGSGISTISQDDLANIPDYSYQEDLDKLNKDKPQRYQMFSLPSGPVNYSAIDNETLKFSIPDENRLKNRYSLEAWNKRGIQNVDSTMMNKIASRSQAAQPMMLALNDSIGIVEELCYWINNANALSEWVMKNERHWENTSCAAVNVVEEYIKNNVPQKDMLSVNQENYRSDLSRKNVHFYDRVYKVQHPILTASWSPSENQKRVVAFWEEKRSTILLDGSKDPNIQKIKDIVIGNIYGFDVTDISSEELDDLFHQIEEKSEYYLKQFYQEKKQEIWDKEYQPKLDNKALTAYQKDITAFLKKQDDYIITIVRDIITWVNTKDFGGINHPLSMVADDFVSDARLDYRAMSNEVISAIYSYENKSPAVADYIVQQFKDGSIRSSHNLVWENILSANQILPEVKQEIIEKLIFINSLTLKEFSEKSQEQLINELNELIKNGVEQIDDPDEITPEMEAYIKGLIADMQWDKLLEESKKDAQVQEKVQDGDATKYVGDVIKWITDAYNNESAVNNARFVGKKVQAALKIFRTYTTVTSFYFDIIHTKMRIPMSHPLVAGVAYASMPHYKGAAYSLMIQSIEVNTRIHREVQSNPTVAERVFNKYGAAIHEAMQKPGFTKGSAGMFFALQVFSIGNYIEAARMSENNEDLYFYALAGGLNALNLSATAYTAALKKSSGIETRLFRSVDCLGNAFGALAGLFSFFTMRWYVKGNNLRTVKMWGDNAVTIFGTANYLSLAATQQSLDVHVAKWVGIKVIRKAGEEIAFLGVKMLLVGLVRFLINPWVGAALALIDLALFLYDIYKDNELQNWLQKSRFGEGDGILSSHFKNAREEADELTNIFEEKKEEIITQLNKKLSEEQKLNQPQDTFDLRFTDSMNFGIQYF